MGDMENTDREEIFSKSVRAGKRTYFFDVKSTRGNDFYLTVTESKKRFEQDGTFKYEKHKLFLYKEDFDKFIEGLNEAIQFIKSQQAMVASSPSSEAVGHDAPATGTVDVNFEDLG